jgi:hypothetical protein
LEADLDSLPYLHQLLEKAEATLFTELGAKMKAAGKEGVRRTMDLGYGVNFVVRNRAIIGLLANHLTPI